MSDWRVFWYPTHSQVDTAVGVSMNVQNQIFRNDREAKAFVVMLIEEDSRGISVNVPDSGRMLNGRDLRAWLGSQELQM